MNLWFPTTHTHTHNTSIVLNFAAVQEKHIKGSEKKIEKQKQHVALVAYAPAISPVGTYVGTE